tara:strand:- start:522 stop:2594 length:2073 start_codon:yes stop_codon:yes gene_type:complete
MAMNTKLTLYRWMPLILVGIMVLSSVSLLTGNTSELNKENFVENTDARQTPEDQLVAECEGITFEDMFVYTHALFDIKINDDWKSADVWGIGWVNGSEAAEVRKDIDELMSNIPGNDATNPLTPNAQGNDGKYSTDERDALEDVGSACVEKTRVRFGLNDVLHREDGEWNNMSWVGDTLLLSDQEIGCVLSQGGDPQGCEITSVEEEDPTYEDGCDGKGDSDCQWVDVTSQRDFVLWVHGTTTFDKIDYNSFTLAVNSTNISSASLKVTMPTTPEPIRLGETQSNLNCDDEWDDEGTIYTADCQSTSIFDKETSSKMVNGGNNYQFETEFSYDFDLWPATQHDFFDFTTAEPEDNNPPEWTDGAPADGTKIPFVNKASEGEQIIFTAEQISSWYYDDYSAAQINCRNIAHNEIITIDSEGNLILDDPSTNDILCELIDGSGQMSEQRGFNLPDLSLSITETEVNDQSLEFDVGISVEGIKYTLSLIQDGESFGTSTEMETDSFEQKVMVDPDSSLKPGPVMVRVTFSGDNVLAKSYDVDLGLTVPSTPPIVQITDYEWLDQDGDGLVDTYVLSGQFSDPDGEEVSLSITMNGAAAGTIEVNGATWTSAGIPFYNYDAGDYTIVIEACDSSNSCVTVEKIVPNLYWAEDIGPTVDPAVLPEPAEEGMPAPGIGITLAGIAIALFASRKRQD